MDGLTLPCNDTASTGLKGRVQRARSDLELASVSAIWKEVYSEELGWLDRDNTDPRNDRYHTNSVYLLATDDSGAPVGVMRMIVDGDQGLPIDKFADISALRENAQGTLIECARLMVPARYRDQVFAAYPYGIFAALVKAALQYCLKEKNYNVLANCFLDTQNTPIKALTHLGFKDLNIHFSDELHETSLCTLLHLDIKDMLSLFYGPEKSIGHYIMARAQFDSSTQGLHA
ncbi:Acetyltransferase (GNAT) domain-containing protein [Pseudomonas syringae]|uniref:N-acyl amino acid synthase FeeM domain-containing protein n=1 Tax=Pseudomonas syringae TaxID=317 RepID=UPI00089BD318|nr:GNAT family N-acyltransferase [Pseudomonas syringae]SDX04178.1 Acetyltransferase (GNAT) domain-containing protein [Pseudomonas syringae]SFM16676.1 Acetyltransferase (GNAT) domain-containing protein [Pseudomonas syringae]